MNRVLSLSGALRPALGIRNLLATLLLARADVMAPFGSAQQSGTPRVQLVQ